MADREKQQKGQGMEDHAGKESRRAFARHLMAAIGGIATLTSAVGAAAFRQAPRGSTADVPISELPWRRTIFCQFDGVEKHKGLFEALAKCAREIGCEIVTGVDGHPDIFACGCFIQILDRNSVGDEMWRHYAAAYKDSGDITPCFIIDDRKDLPLPGWKFSYQINMQDEGSITTIMSTIMQMKAEMNYRLPAFFRNSQG